LRTIRANNLEFLIKEPAVIKEDCKTVFFFALSAQDSLILPPFCNSVDNLIKAGTRVISTTLPCHENNQRPYNIKQLWLEKDEVITTFITDLAVAIKELTEIFPPPYGIMGISRGCLISLHLASTLPEITSIVCFAPLLSLSPSHKLSTDQLINSLANKNIYFFVGHNDSLIGTNNVIQFNNNLIEVCQNSKINPNIQTKLSPSIGRHGHGTSDEIFHEGALWLAKTL
tara:strand:+ start:585 stop:1268 length:684 start_codon:yes stop_codon:yes gene_type:complete